MLETRSNIDQLLVHVGSKSLPGTSGRLKSGKGALFVCSDAEKIDPRAPSGASAPLIPAPWALGAPRARGITILLLNKQPAIKTFGGTFVSDFGTNLVLLW